MAEYHAPVLKRLGVEFSAVCGQPGSPRAKAFARRFGIPKTARSWQELVKDRTVDALWVTTPETVTGKLLLSLLNTSKPVFLEKPIALESETIGKALQIERRLKKPVAVGMNRRFYDFIPELQAILKTHVPKTVVIHLPEQAAGSSTKPWFASSIHEIDLLFYLLGEIRSRTIHISRPSGKNPLPSFQGLLEGGPSRIPIHLVGTWGTPWNKSLQFFFSDFVVELNPIERLRIYRGMRKTPPTSRTPIARFQPSLKKEAWTSHRYKPGIYAQDKAVVDWMRSGTPAKGVATLTDAYQATRLIERVLS